MTRIILNNQSKLYPYLNLIIGYEMAMSLDYVTSGQGRDRRSLSRQWVGWWLHCSRLIRPSKQIAQILITITIIWNAYPFPLPSFQCLYVRQSARTVAEHWQSRSPQPRLSIIGLLLSNESTLGFVRIKPVLKPKREKTIFQRKLYKKLLFR